MIPEIEFRIGDEADALCVGVLAIQVFLDTYATDGIRPDLAREALANYAPEIFSKRFLDQDTTFVMAESSGHLVGFCEVSRNRQCPLDDTESTVELVRLYIQPGSQGLGLGRALMARAEILAIDAGSDSLWLTAWEGNEKALAFYHSLGYIRQGTTTYQFEDQTYENKILIKSGLEPAT